ncbi:MAG: ATP-binding protein [Desulfobacterales bacterium]|nr:ATP-binding protein [Desulfobacterales bacterium]
MILRFFKKESIAKRFIFRILIFSSCITFLLTAIQLMFDYIRDVNLIEDKLFQIETSYQQAFAQSVWVLDHGLLKAQIEGILKIPDIQFLEIRKEGRPLIAMGKPKDKNIIVREFELFYTYQNSKIHLGTCILHADLEGVYNRLIEKAVIILLGQGTKTFLVSIFIFFLFYNLIGKHLKTITDFTQNLNLNKEQLLILKRPKCRATMNDELALVSKSINTMVFSLQVTYKDLLLTNKTLKREISERQHAEDHLQENHALLNAIIEGTSDAIFLKNLNGEYELANTACLKAFGRSKEEVIGKKDEELLPPESAKVVIEVDKRVVESNRTCMTEDRLETAYGDTYWLSNKNPFRDKNGNIKGLIGISRNITDIKKAEKSEQELKKRLQQAQKMEAIGTLAGGIAHDFNNILTVIFGYTDIAMGKVEKGSPVEKALKRVKTAGHRAKDLVSQILTFSRQDDANHTAILPVPVIKEGIKMLRSSIPATITINENIDPGCRTILADSTQLHQILINLCTNAYHAMEEKGGELTISLLNRETQTGDPSEKKSGQFVVLTISDTGPGIPREHQERIFEPYFTTKELGKGTGMGLAIVHGIVKSFGGDISLYSTPETGTRFEICFPASKDLLSQKQGPDQTIIAGTEHILFIDDEEAIVAMGENLLESLGYKVTAKQDSFDALQTFKENPDGYDLVISDQTMPGMTGMELSKKILQINPDTPIILNTGYSAQVSEKRVKEAGIFALMYKPATKKEYAAKIRNALDNRKNIPPVLPEGYSTGSL